MFPITLPVTDGLGESAAGALNALAPIPVSGGGRRPCARGPPIRMSLFLYSTVTCARASVDSHDALSVFEATDVDDLLYDWGASSRRPRLSYGCSHHARWLGYPLLIPSTIFSFSFHSGGYLVPLILLSDTCPFLPLVSLFLFFVVPGTCPFLFPRIFYFYYFFFRAHPPRIM